MFTQRASLLSSLLSLLSLLTVAAALSGCSNMVGTAPTESTEAGPGTLTGTVHGGSQPVANATVTLWAAGNTGYGSAATQLATTTSNSSGGFSFGPGSGHTYSCPSSVSPTASQSLYITASGGQPTAGTTNNQAAFLLALGDCVSTQTANPAVNLNEVTTVASITALQQFFAPNTSSGLGSIGTSATNTLGLANAMKTVANLVNLSTGAAYASTTVSGIIPSYSTTLTITPEQAKINTMADILAACVNSSGSGSAACGTLFGNVGNTTPLDTLQAAYYMASNPTGTSSTSSVKTCTTGTAVTTSSTICNLYGLVGTQVPFAPTLSAAPTDWTIGVTYGSSSAQTVGATSVYLLNSPQYVALDSVGDLWIVNSTTVAAGAAGNSVTELSPVGVPEAQVLTTAGQLTGPRNIVVDPSNNLYVANYGTAGAGASVAAYNASTLTAETYPLASVGPVAMASDGAGNIYVADLGAVSTGGAGDLEIIPAKSTSGTAATQIGTAVSAGPNSVLAIDSYSDLWLSNYGNTATTQFICGQRPCTATATTAGGETAPRSIVVDHANNIWVGNSGSPGSMSEIAATSSTAINGAANSPFSGGGLSNPTFSIFDGLGNQWITNSNGANGSVTELTATGAAVSPANGLVHTYNGPVGIGIDGSGNVWLGNASAAPAAFITEIVGAAGPAITPYSANLPVSGGGANKIGSRP
jgi:hypothetical protein